MKCPHCGYVDGWDNETHNNINGKYGKFFQLPIEMERTNVSYGYLSTQSKVLFACPAEDCGKTFIVN